MSFAAGFYGRGADIISDKRAFIRNRVEEDRTYLREEGLKRQAAVQQQRLAYQTAAQSLIDRGANEDAVLANLQRNPQGVLDIYNRDITDSTQLNAIFEINDEYSADGSTLEDIINKVLPVTSQLPAGTDRTTVKRAGIAAWLGLDTEAALNEQVYSAQIVGGMTGDQILASMNVPVNAVGDRSRSGATINYDAVDDEPLTDRDRRSYISSAWAEYAPLVEGQRAALSEEILAIEDKESEEALAIKKKIDVLDNLSGMTDSEKLSALIPMMGVLPNTAEMYQMNPGIFNSDYFDITTREYFEATKPEENTDPNDNTGVDPGVITVEELPPAGLGGDDGSSDAPPPGEYANEFEGATEALEAAKTFFEANPDLQFFWVKLGGEVRKLENPSFNPRDKPGALGYVDITTGPDRRPNNRGEQGGLGAGPDGRPNNSPPPPPVNLNANQLVEEITGGYDETGLKQRLSRSLQVPSSEGVQILQEAIRELQEDWTQSKYTDTLVEMLNKSIKVLSNG